jgi:hypothetical protein
MNARAVSLVPSWSGALAVLAAIIATTACGADVVEQKFPLLKIGTQYFTNATVTTHTTNYVFIHHSGGMVNLKIAKLSEEERENLGYRSTAKATGTNSVTAWAKNKVTNLQRAELKDLKQTWSAYLPKTMPSPKTLPIGVLLIVCSTLLLVHLFFSFCCKCICEKTGTDSGPAIWFPIMQLVPLVRAAGMAPAWFLAFLVPGLNLIAQIIWSFKIVQARGKSTVVALGLLLPVTNVLSFLYLAFSSGTPKEEKGGPEIMTLGAF